MVEAKLTQANENNRKRINRFDEQGRIIESTSEYWSNHYQYIEKEDTLMTTIMTYRSDTLLNSQYYSTLLKFNQTNHYIKKDHTGKVIIEMTANFDAYGNATAYYINDLTNKYHGNKHYPPTSYRIENTYNQDNLLAKRMFYYSRADVGKDLLTKIEKYCYDKALLPFKMKMGLLRAREIMEEEMIDH